MSRFVLAELGIVSALGCGCDETMRNLSAGKAVGMRPVALAGGETSVFGFAPGWGPERPAEVPAGATRVGTLLDKAMAQLDLAKLYAEVPPERVGVVLGTSNSTMEEFTDNPDKIDMAYPAERIRAKWGAKGPAWSVSTACSSSAKVFASARRLLEHGLCDAVVVGGVDAYTRTVVEGFHSLEALSSTLCRPCAKGRDGINLGEGAAIFVMRRGEAVSCGEVERGRIIELLGVGESSDAHHLTAPDPEGKGAEASMRAALADAGLNPGDVNFVNLHGTGTVYNDAMECAAVERVFGRGICRTSTKPLTGHCLGAAGAIEAALCWLYLRGRDAPCRALSNSFAFGGSNASVILGIAGKPAKPTLSEMLPQAEPMILLSDYEAPADGVPRVVAHVDIDERSPFYEVELGGTPSTTALEYMAQTMALCVGFERRRQGLKPKIGFVLGSRKLETFVPCFRKGERYQVVAECTYTDDEFGSFDCEISDSAGAVCAKATVTAFQPDFETTPDKLETFT